MAGKYGVQESLEAMIALLKIGKEIKKVVKDGAQLSDFAALYMAYQADPKLREALDAGIKDIAKAKEEIAELDLADGMALASGLIGPVQEFLA